MINDPVKKSIGRKYSSRYHVFDHQLFERLLAYGASFTSRIATCA
jgi:hypothetical protein